jgi:high-affinity iron transporter
VFKPFVHSQVLLGSALGLLLALAIGAAFLAVYFTKASNLYQKSEELWEGNSSLPFTRRGLALSSASGIFQLIASIMIFVMGITMLRIDRAKAKWRVKLQRAFQSKSQSKSLASRVYL